MNKIKKVIMAVIIFYAIYYIYGVYHHSFHWRVVCKQYMWLFKESIKNSIDPASQSICYSLVKKRDIYNIFHYHQGSNMYPMVIWEFKDMANADLNKIPINQHVDFGYIKVRGEIFDSQSSSPVTVKYTAAFHNAMNVNLDGLSKIDGTFSGPNYKGFYGSINKMSFSNEKGEHQIIFDYSYKPHKDSFSPTVFLLYKGHQSFYVIIVNSEQPFKDASIINIFNLQ